MGVYLDERADPEQAEALGAIFSGQAGGWPAVLSALIAEASPAQTGPIEFEIADDNVPHLRTGTAGGGHRAGAESPARSTSAGSQGQQPGRALLHRGP